MMLVQRVAFENSFQLPTNVLEVSGLITLLHKSFGSLATADKVAVSAKIQAAQTVVGSGRSPVLSAITAVACHIGRVALYKHLYRKLLYSAV